MIAAMPPRHAVEYRVEASPRASMDDFMSKASQFLGAQRAAVEAAPSVESRAAQATSLPQLDLGSRALSQEDRGNLAIAAGAGTFTSARDLASIPRSSSYVGERIALAVRMQEMAGKAESGWVPSQREAKDFRCAVVRIAMDSRAGAYVQGGERAAAAMRASIPAAEAESCKPTSLRAQAAALSGSGAVRVDPRSAPVKASEPVRVAPQAGRAQRVAVNPSGVRAAAQRVSVDPTTAKPVHLELKGRPDPVHIDLVAYAASKGRGMAG